MVRQGRPARVILCLMAAMTIGAIVLLALEGKPIKPMAFSLASQVRLPALDSALGARAKLEPGRWSRLEMCYRPNNGQLSRRHGLTGELAAEYHFVIANGNGAEDGEILASRRWVQQRSCPAAGDSPEARRTIRICLIRDEGQAAITERQVQQLEALVASLSRHCREKFQIAWTD